MSDATNIPEQSRRSARRLALVCALALGFTGITLAVGNPGFLADTSVSVPAGSKSYQVWYTTDCDGAEGCDCDKVNDKDTSDPPDGTLDADTSDSCLATIDDDNDGVLNIVDLDWAAAGPGVVESVPLNVQKTVNRYVNDWKLKEPYWNTGDTDRPIYVYDIDARGYAAGNGNDYDAGVMKGNGPEPRGTVLHELWHSTQFAYGIDTGSWLLEGQARYMQDKVFDDLDNLVASRYHNSVNAYLGNTTWNTTEDRDDDGTDEFNQPKGLLGASYDASLWWTYLSDQAGTKFGGTAGVGVDLLQAVLEQSSENG
ncbi:MAG TPA: hypothetical protein VD886_19275, partial [Herpetosiphonaceae bacterium]|nr:hypothetical protein [Herpetosiphonaceae bacterium]